MIIQETNRMAPEEIHQPSSFAQQLRSIMGKPITSKITERKKCTLGRTRLEFYPIIFCFLFTDLGRTATS